MLKTCVRWQRLLHQGKTAIFVLLALITTTHAGKFSIMPDAVGYAGEYTDAESQLQYLHARYYQPESMRLTSIDGIDLLNKYAYAAGNPIMNEDPSGHIAAWAGALIAFGGAAVLGSAVEGGSMLIAEGRTTEKMALTIDASEPTEYSTPKISTRGRRPHPTPISTKKDNHFNFKPAEPNSGDYDVPVLPEEPGSGPYNTVEEIRSRRGSFAAVSQNDKAVAQASPYQKAVQAARSQSPADLFDQRQAFRASNGSKINYAEAMKNLNDSEEIYIDPRALNLDETTVQKLTQQEYVKNFTRLHNDAVYFEACAKVQQSIADELRKGTLDDMTAFSKMKTMEAEIRAIIENTI